MNTIKIPDGWYQLCTGEEIRLGDQYYDRRDGWIDTTCFKERVGWDEGCGGPTLRYIRRMDWNQLEAERARLDPKYRPAYQNAPQAKETASNGILAAAHECVTESWADGPAVDTFKAIISRHCIGKEEVASLERRLKWAQVMGEKHHEGDRASCERANTEKARADNLQAELESTQQALSSLRSCALSISDRLLALVKNQSS